MCMKKICLFFCFSLSLVITAQKAVKVKELKLKYTLPENWNAETYVADQPWESGNNPLCKCAAGHSPALRWPELRIASPR